MTILKVATCPTCGSRKIKKVRRNWSGKVHDQSYTVPLLEFYECSVCGEKIFDRQALRKIEEHSPAFAKTRASKIHAPVHA